MRSSVILILKEGQGLTQQMGVGGGGGEEKRKKIPKKRKQARAKTEAQKNKMFLENFHCLVILLNIKWKVENGNKCHPSKIRVRSGKSKSQHQPVIYFLVSSQKVFHRYSGVKRQKAWIYNYSLVGET